VHSKAEWFLGALETTFAIFSKTTLLDPWQQEYAEFGFRSMRTPKTHSEQSGNPEPTQNRVETQNTLFSLIFAKTTLLVNDPWQQEYAEFGFWSMRTPKTHSEQSGNPEPTQNRVETQSTLFSLIFAKTTNYTPCKNNM
jgi:hypothetical protein